MGKIGDRRSSDGQIILMQHKFDNHIKEFHTHCDSFRRHCDEEDRRWGQLITVQEYNTFAIKELTESTRDLIRAWQAANGTVKVMSVVGRFVKWLAGFAVVGTVVKWFIDHS